MLKATRRERWTLRAQRAGGVALHLVLMPFALLYIAIPLIVIVLIVRAFI
jgi:hypothetical protein